MSYNLASYLVVVNPRVVISFSIQSYTLALPIVSASVSLTPVDASLLSNKSIAYCVEEVNPIFGAPNKLLTLTTLPVLTGTLTFSFKLVVLGFTTSIAEVKSLFTLYPLTYALPGDI